MQKISLVIAAAAVFLSATAAFADNSNKVPYRKNVSVKVGQSIVIHGLRGECGMLPKESAVTAMEKRYRDIKVGKITAGKKGVRNSASCGGRTPVVEAIFTAQQKGRVKIDLFGDIISIRVK